MEFIVYQYVEDPDRFVVTDVAHERDLPAGLGPDKGELRRVGSYPEMGADRVAFNESIARNAIEKHGFYLFEASSFAAIPEAPEMPG